ncbi:MAG: hypothetical protein ABI459_12210, partial [Deltaproteobacteria bacterium]
AQTKRRGVMAGGIAFGVIILGAAIALMFDADPFATFGFMGLGLIITVSVTLTYIRRERGQILMPILTDAVGLMHRKDDYHYIENLPDLLLPAGRRVIDDSVTGAVGDRRFTFAQARVFSQTSLGSDKNSVERFHGAVFTFRSHQRLPSFALIPQDKTTKLRTDGFHTVETHSGADARDYRVMVREDTQQMTPQLAAIVETLTGLAARVEPQATLYAARHDDGLIHIAISTKRRLFKLGGVFNSDATLTQDLRAAMANLNIPLDFCAAILACEAKFPADQD